MAGPRSNGSIHPIKPRTSTDQPAPLPAPPTPGAEWTLDIGRPRAIVERLLDRPDAAKLVRRTPVQPLFLFIKSLGLADATDLLRLCSAEQVQAFVDLDCWQRDRLVPARVYPWVTALLELGYTRFVALLKRFDPQLITTFLAPQVRVYELTDEEPPEDPQGLPYVTPDRFYMVDIVPEADANDGADEVTDRQGLLQRFFDELYRGDLDFARVIISAARWDGGTEAEEQAYRFRSGRMADLGYIDYYDALKVYMLVDPLKAPPAQPLAPEHASPVVGAVASPEEEVPVLGAGGMIGPRSAVWRQLVPNLDESDFTFGRAAALLTDSEQARLFEHLLLLGNQAMAADRIELGDFDGTQQTLRRTMGYLSLGLEFRLRAPPGTPAGELRDLQIDPKHAAQILREVPLLYLFRLGYSLTLQLRKLVTLLVQSGLTTLVPKEDPASLLLPEQAAPLRALLELRPLYSLLLDLSPSPPKTARAPAGSSRPADDDGDTPRRREVRPFQSLRDLGRAAALIERLSAVDKLMTTGLGLRRDTMVQTLTGKSPGPAAVKLDDIVGTMVANLLLDRPPVLVPLPRRDLAQLRWRALGDAPAAPPGTICELRPEVTTKVMATLQARVQERSLNEAETRLLWSPALQDFVRTALSRLATGLAALPPTLTDAQADVIPRVPGLVLG